MFHPAQAWQPQFDPPLPPFRTSCLQSWFKEFEAAMELNIWLQEFMFQVLEYHPPRDLKRHLTYFSWSPRPYDDLRHGVLQFYGIRHRPFLKSDPATLDTPSSTWTPSAPWPVQTVPLPTTGYTAEPVPPLCITDLTPATGPCTVTFAAESCAAPLAPRGDSTITDEPADLAAEHTPVLILVEARDTARFANTSAPAAQAPVDCQSNHDLSSNALNGSQSSPDVPARISSDLSEEPHPTPSCLSTTQAPSVVERLHEIYAQRPTRGPSRTDIVLSTGALLSALKKLHRAMVGFASTRAFCTTSATSTCNAPLWFNRCR
ncbi:hypothetical protein HPB52_021875 [Rhipicephalus sanguineus]|uniref:Uncharacterized protein n=1 Tax=Rhipicephalus sanguineus TaxID=34632 RepID=A0A9D4PH78_RHISA|nr:hypothetical protein HPB52_021875 [Rhipicephalus sanguineus]